MNQNFGFMGFLIPNIISEEKTITNRILTPFREKCDMGDIMHCFENYRKKTAFKFADAKVLFTVNWKSKNIPVSLDDARRIRSPLLALKWLEFSRLDGFIQYSEFQDFFYGKGHLKCFQFEIIHVYKRG